MGRGAEEAGAGDIQKQSVKSDPNFMRRNIQGKYEGQLSELVG